jgi:uncharacterized protein YceK
VLRLLALLSIVCSAGCGTLVTAVEDDKGDHWRFGPYSGTRISAGGHSTQIDLPFSLIADTMFLPITIPKYFIDKAKEPGLHQSNSHERTVKERDSGLKVWFVVGGFLTCLLSNSFLIRSCFKQSKAFGMSAFREMTHFEG